MRARLQRSSGSCWGRLRPAGNSSRARTCAPLQTRLGCCLACRRVLLILPTAIWPVWSVRRGAGRRRGGQCGAHLNAGKQERVGSQLGGAVQCRGRNGMCARESGSMRRMQRDRTLCAASREQLVRARAPVWTPAQLPARPWAPQAYRDRLQASRSSAGRRLSRNRPAPAAALAQLLPPAAADRLKRDSLTTVRPSPGTANYSACFVCLGVCPASHMSLTRMAHAWAGRRAVACSAALHRKARRRGARPGTLSAWISRW